MAKAKQWRNGGELDKFVEKLIKKGKINKHTKPGMLLKTYPNMFGGFSSNVVRNHLNTLKRSQGLYLDGEDDSENDDTDDDESTSNAVEKANPNQSVGDGFATTSQTGFSKLTFTNYPVLCETFADPVTLNQKVIMVVNLPAGSTHTDIELSDDGSSAIVKCSWSNTIFKMEELFRSQLAAKTLDLLHPKIMCLKNGLAKSRRRIDAIPDTFIKVELPLKVQTAATSWSHFGVKREDGTLVVVAEFEGFVKEYTKKLSDSTVKFDQ